MTSLNESGSALMQEYLALHNKYINQAFIKLLSEGIQTWAKYCRMQYGK